MQSKEKIIRVLVGITTIIKTIVALPTELYRQTLASHE